MLSLIGVRAEQFKNRVKLIPFGLSARPMFSPNIHDGFVSFFVNSLEGGKHAYHLVVYAICFG